VSEETLNANSTLDKVLGYVDSPFKLIAILVMGVVAFAGYFVYTNQDLLIGAYKESKKIPSIAEDRVEDASAHLFKTTNATIVAVFKVNPMFGTRVLYRAYAKDGRDKTNDGLDVGLFTQNAANKTGLKMPLPTCSRPPTPLSLQCSKSTQCSGLVCCTEPTPRMGETKPMTGWM